MSMSKSSNIPDKLTAKEFQSLISKGELDFSGTRGKVKDLPKKTMSDFIHSKDRIFTVGIDPGTHTGIAIFSLKEKKFHQLATVNIIEAMEGLKHIKGMIISVTVEDARQAQYGRRDDVNKAQGAGSIKRDCKIWEEFLTYHNIPHRFVRPNKNISKLNDKVFKQITKFQGRTSNHARDAGMLVYNS